MNDPRDWYMGLAPLTPMERFQAETEARYEREDLMRKPNKETTEYGDPDCGETSLKITKLPKWAQDHIHELQRQRDVAVRSLQDWQDDQTESPFSIEDAVHDGDKGPTFRKRYVQAHKMTVDFAGVHLQIMLRLPGIELRWCGCVRLGLDEVAFIPDSHQGARLVAKEHMR